MSVGGDYINIFPMIRRKGLMERLESNRLMTLYQIVHDAIHARSGQEQGPLKLQCIRTEREIVMGWVSFGHFI